MMTSTNAPEREEIESLLPWHAAGTLSRRDAERVEAALGRDQELARRYQLVREELAETIQLNESLGAPSARAMNRLFAAIDAESPAAKRSRLDIGGRLAALLASLSPRTLAWSAAVAGLAIVLQAGLLAGLVMKDRGGPFGTASRDVATSGQGAFALIRFNPVATAGDITKFLDANKATIIEGPKGDFYRVRVAVTALPKEELAKIVARLGEDKAVVGTILPGQ